MKISAEEIEHLSRLSRLELEPEEKEKFSKELTGIVDYIDQLKKLDTKEVKPYLSAISGRFIGREDEIEKFSKTGKIIKAAPKVRFGKFKVKAVFK